MHFRQEVTSPPPAPAHRLAPTYCEVRGAGRVNWRLRLGVLPGHLLCPARARLCQAPPLALVSSDLAKGPSDKCEARPPPPKCSLRFEPAAMGDLPGLGPRQVAPHSLSALHVSYSVR